MARRQTCSAAEETECNVTGIAFQRRRTNIDLVRTDNRPFESPRGRGRNNAGWGRVDGMPFVSPRGRGRRIPLQTRSHDPDTDDQQIAQHCYDLGQVQRLTAPDGTLYYTGLVRLDGKPFESPRGRGRNLNLRRSDGNTFSSHSDPIVHQKSSADTYAPSAPYEDILDVDYN